MLFAARMNKHADFYIEMMTPMDLVRAITPGVPPSPMNKPINIPMFETPAEDVRRILTEEECPDFFKFSHPDDLGLISYGRFLILVALLSIPSEQLSVVYHMSCGKHFLKSELRGNGLGAKNLDFILDKHLRTRAQGYSNATHSKTSIHRHLFGPDLDRELTFEEFKTLHTNLLHEALKLEYAVLSDIEGGGMSLIGFSRSIVARVPTEYRDIILKRAALLEGELKNQPESEMIVTLEQYAAWKEVLKQLENMERAVKLYSHLDGHFSPSNLRRSARAVAGVELTKEQVWVLFKLFDLNDDDVLAHEEFVRILSNNHGVILHLQGAQGLALGHLGECCWNCITSWYDGTYKDSDNKEEVT